MGCANSYFQEFGDYIYEIFNITPPPKEQEQCFIPINQKNQKPNEYYTIKGDKDLDPTFQFIDISNDYSDL